MNPRIFHLIDLARYELAEQELRRHLTSEPNDDQAHAWLAVCLSGQDKHQAALPEAKAALAINSEEPFNHYVLGTVHCDMNHYDEAMRCAEMGIQLDPENAIFQGLKATIGLGRQNWKEALQAAEKGLSLNPTDQRCQNIRSLALTQLGRHGEAKEAIQESLKEDPENPMAHANLGWSLLHQHKHRESLEHFREALRIDPNYEWARSGMLTALKARYFLYRLMLRFFLWMSTLPPKIRSVLIIGIFILFRILRSVIQAYPALRPYTIPLIVLYVGFVLMTWISTPLFNLLLRLNKYGKYLLNPHERLASTCLGLLLCGGLLSLGAGFLTSIAAFFVLGIFQLLLVLPITRLFGSSGKRRCISRATVLILIVCGIAALGATLLGYDSVGQGITGIGAVVFIIFTWAFAFSGV